MEHELNNLKGGVFHIGNFDFDCRRQLLSIGDKKIRLTAKENDLLVMLCSHANDVVMRSFALNIIWHDNNYFTARTMDVYITKLRKHLKDDVRIEIVNIRGKGHMLVVP